MKRTLTVFAIMITMSSFSAMDDMLISFLTPGVDRYSDGSRVKNGESYALTWTKNGYKFGGLNDKCQLISAYDKIVMVAPLAKRGRCPLTVVEIASSETSQYLDGTFSLYLLDTRKVDSNGKTNICSYVNGFPEVVNSIGLAVNADKNMTVERGSFGKVSGTDPILLGNIGIYTEIENPVITVMSVEDENINLIVDNMSDTAEYFVVPGSNMTNFSKAISTKPDGNTFRFRKPVQKFEFYKIIGVRKF